MTDTYCRRVSYIRCDVLLSTCICSDNICYRTNVHVYIRMCVLVQVIHMCVRVHCTRDLYTAYASAVQVTCDLYTAYACTMQVTRHTHVLCKLHVQCTHTHIHKVYTCAAPPCTSAIPSAWVTSTQT